MEVQLNRRIVGNAASRRKKMIAFGWYGGKFSHLDFLLPNLPNGERHFCDVFGITGVAAEKDASDCHE